jgi:hypothetical protein
MYGQATDWAARVTALREQFRAASGVDRLTVGTSLVNAIGNAASNTTDPTLRARWLAAYNALRPALASLRATYAPQPPAAWLRALDVFSDHALSVADDVGKGIGATARALPLILPVVAIGIGALYLLPLLRKRGGSRG